SAMLSSPQAGTLPSMSTIACAARRLARSPASSPPRPSATARRRGPPPLRPAKVADAKWSSFTGRESPFLLQAPKSAANDSRATPERLQDNRVDIAIPPCHVRRRGSMDHGDSGEGGKDSRFASEVRRG